MTETETNVDKTKLCIIQRITENKMEPQTDFGRIELVRVH